MNTKVTEVVLASDNQGKIQEFSTLFATTSITLRTQQAFGISSAEETASTFVENALLKARHASKHAGLPALADDSGLIVDALNGAPGVLSARFSGEHATAKDNNHALLAAIKPLTGTLTARYYCVLVFLRYADDPAPIIAEASWEGEILRKPQGTHGFGYDPIFFAHDIQQAVATVPANIKNALSHRAKATQKLMKKLPWAC